MTTVPAPSAVDVFGVAAVVIALLPSVPQLVRTVRAGSVSGVSLPGLANAAVSNVAWTAYALWLGDRWLLAASAVAVPGALAAACVAWRCGGRVRDLGLPTVWVTLLAVSTVGEVLGRWQVLAVVVGASITWLVLPAAVDAWRSHDVNGVSAGMWAFLAVEGLVAIGYGVTRASTAPVVFGVVEVIGSGVVLLRLATARTNGPRAGQASSRRQDADRLRTS